MKKPKTPEVVQAPPAIVDSPSGPSDTETLPVVIAHGVVILKDAAPGPKQFTAAEVVLHDDGTWSIKHEEFSHAHDYLANDAIRILRKLVQEL